MVLGVLQPLNACFRPRATPEGEKKDKKRFIWEVAHKTSGYFAVVVSFVTVYYGISLGYSPIGQYESYFIVAFWMFVLFTIARWLLAMYMRFTKKRELPTAN